MDRETSPVRGHLSTLLDSPRALPSAFGGREAFSEANQGRMSDTGLMAEQDLDRLVEPVKALSQFVAKDENVAVFVFKANGDTGLVSSLSEQLVTVAIMRWLSVRMLDMAGRPQSN